MSLTPAMPASGAKAARGKERARSASGLGLPCHTTPILESGRSDALGPKLLTPRFRPQIGEIGGNRDRAVF